MAIAKVSRRNFLSTAALSSAALGLFSHEGHAQAPETSGEAEWFYTRKEWDAAPFNKLLRARKTIKQIFDMKEADGEMLADHVHNSLTGLERGFGIPGDKILAVAALRAHATILNFDNYAWKKYQIGAGYKIKDPRTGKPAERNIYYASTMAPDGNYASGDPNDPRAIEADPSIQSLQRRGVQLLCCHVAAEGTAHYAVKRLKLKESLETVARDLLAHMLPGVIVVPSMVSAIPILETHGRFTYLRL